MTPAANTFVWYELMTNDVAGASAFYDAVVGWTSTRWEGSEQPYTILQVGERGVAGLLPMPAAVRDAGGRPGWLGYVGVPDVDAATAALREAGGAVHRAPSEIPGVGRFAVVADPQGAIFMLLAPERKGPPPLPAATPGAIGWHELHCSDWTAALAFYAGQFGWTKDMAVDMGPIGTYQLFAAGGPAVGGMMNRMDPTMPPSWQFYFTVEAIDAAKARVEAAGGMVVQGPHQVPGGSWILHGLDPEGARFALTSLQR